jgi:hypothetical protein
MAMAMTTLQDAARLLAEQFRRDTLERSASAGKQWLDGPSFVPAQHHHNHIPCGAGGAGASTGWTGGCGVVDTARAPMPLRDLISIRLHRDVGAELGFEHIDATRSGDMVFVFVVQCGVPVTIEDSYALFPSDALVTQLRLLEKTPS